VSRGPTFILALSLGALGWALLVWLTGGIDGRILGVAVRARGAWRPLAFGLSLFFLYAILERQRIKQRLVDPAAWLEQLAPWLAATAALATTIVAIRYGAFVAGGSDAYGYLSQAYGWASGHLPRAYDIPLTLPISNSDWLQTPLGWWPGRAPHTIVPSYAPGLPLLMAIGIRLADPVGPYLVVPICAGLFVWATFVLARRMTDATWALVAALLAATSPIVLFMSLMPMSDVPAGTAWTASTAAAVARSRRGAVLSGLFAGLGVLIRPNLAPLAIPLVAFLLATTQGAERWRRAALFCAVIVPAAIAIAALNASWYGSPFLSGYGNPRDLYAMANIGPNLRNYLQWLWQSQSPFILVVALSLIVLVRPSPQRQAVALAWSVCVVTLLCYVSYERYEQWWFLRFLVPGLGVFFAVVAVSLRVVAIRVPRPWGGIVARAIAALLLWHAASYAAAQGMFGPFKASEHKYADAGAFVARQLPADAVVFAMQHSGSIRYYGGRQTLRYDLLDRAWAPRAPAEIERIGLHPYLAIEDGELDDVRTAFGVPRDRPLPWPVVARMTASGGFSVYDLAAQPAGAAPLRIEAGSAPAYSAPLQVSIQPRGR